MTPEFVNTASGLELHQFKWLGDDELIGALPPQLTFRAVALAIVLAMVLAAANTYLGLFAGMTIASAIPAAVVSMAVLGALGGAGILENNIVQTGASAGSSIASGVIFTIPALVILGYCQDFQYAWVLAIAGLGGILGVLFSVPLRRALIVEQKLAFLARVKETVERVGYCVIVVSEGTAYADGRFLADAGTKDAFGHTQLGGVAPFVAHMIREAHGYKYHWAVADYLQRAARHIASKTDVEQAFAMGKAAVELAVRGQNAVMPIVVRKSSRPYRWTVGHVELAKVANVEHKLPRDFITPDGFGITEKCRRHLLPLIDGEAPPPFRDGLPVYVKLRGAKVRKRLPPFKA